MPIGSGINSPRAFQNAHGAFRFGSASGSSRRPVHPSDLPVLKYSRYIQIWAACLRLQLLRRQGYLSGQSRAPDGPASDWRWSQKRRDGGGGDGAQLAPFQKERSTAARAAMPAALLVETELEGLEGVKLLSPGGARRGSPSSLPSSSRAPRAPTGSARPARAWRATCARPRRRSRPISPTESPLPSLLSRGRAAKLQIENEAKKQTAERAGTKQAERLRRLNDGLNEKASLALEKRKEVLAENSQKAKKHNAAVEGKLKKTQAAEEHRLAELKAKLEPSIALEKRKEVLAESSQKAKKHNAAVEDKLKRTQEAEEHRLAELKAKLEPSIALEKRKEVLAESSQRAKKHNEAIAEKLKRFQEADEHRREELKAKLGRKTGSKVSGKVFSDGLGTIGVLVSPMSKFAPPARARRLSEPAVHSGSFITGAAENSAWPRLVSAMLVAAEVA
ncbi:unnamed protein product [Prorocentrum cordatum]|uniref:Uncharacterized protein n=1 Tax=Prorocentrum cordatum TaxID=2364126 RepID=A0ABN9VUX1_9DINO|nr:unnamed protein product [Polarella glacialis]